LDQEAKETHAEESPHYFAMIKRLTVLGYFTSEPGITKALRYNPGPGRLESCALIKKGRKPGQVEVIC
jgi:hypothetical protein